MYLVHNKKVELDFFEYISADTYDVKELNENFLNMTAWPVSETE